MQPIFAACSGMLMRLAPISLCALITCAPGLSAQTQFQSWLNTYDSTANRIDRPIAVAVAPSGGILVAGTSQNASGHDDILVVRLDGSTGNQLWERRYDGPGLAVDRASALAVNASGDVLVTGSSANSSGHSDLLTLKLDGASGALLWESRIDGSGAGDDAATGLAIDSSGDVLVVGHLRNAAGHDDFAVLKLDGATGTTVWSVTEDGAGAGADRAVGIAVSSTGDAFVTGYARNGSGNDDFLTVRLRGSDGMVLWEIPFNGPASGKDRASDIAIDDSGDVLVTGTSRGTGGNDDFHTAKLAASDGAVLWEARYNGPANDSDTPSGLAVDPAGNVVVTGISWNGSNQDIFTAKYAAIDGEFLWGSRYNGPANRADAGVGVAVDSAGNAVVVGYSWNTNADAMTLLLNGDTGSVTWSRRYTGSGADDNATALFVDDEDHIVTTGETWSGNQSDFFTTKFVRVAAPAPLLTGLGDPAAFAVSAGAGLPVTYAWRKNGVTIGGANDEVYAINAVAIASAGAYSVTLRNALDSVVTPAANLGVVNLDSREVLVNEGSTATLKLSYSGQGLSFLWFKGAEPLVNGGRISGATSGTLRISAATGSDVATYTCRVTLGGQTLISGNFAINLRFRPAIVSTPADTLLIGIGDASSLQVTASGTDPLSYRWFKDGVAIPGATEPSYDFESARLSQAGSYTVRVSNAVASVTSPASRVGVVDVAPRDVLVNEGATAVLTLPAAGAGLSFAWYRDGSRLNNEGNLTGTGTRSLRISNTGPADIDSYYCEVTLGTRRITSGDFFLAIRRKPVMNGYSPGTWIVGGDVFDTLSANNDPDSFSVTGLPPGVICNARTGEISGKPRVAGSYPLVITARNAAGVSTAIGNTITVLPLPGLTPGLFTGLVEREDSINGGLGGTVSLLISSTGSYSGAFQIKGQTYRFRSQLDTFLTNSPSSLVRFSPHLEFDFVIDSDTGELSGTLSDDSAATAAVTARRNPWDARANPATAYAGTYASALEPQSAWLNNLDFPQGNGYGRLTLTSAGRTAWSGSMADGSRATSSGYLASSGQFALHFSLYRASGSAQGWAQITPGTPAAYLDNTVTGSLDWFKQGPVSGRSYASGFAVHGLDLMGGKYTPPGLGDLVLNLPDQADNAMISFAGALIDEASLASQLNRTFRINEQHQGLLNTGFSNPARLELRINPATGALQGSFRLQDQNPLNLSQTLSREVTYSGLLVPSLGIGVGHFQLPRLPQAGPPETTLSTSPMLSGQMVIEPAQ